MHKIIIPINRSRSLGMGKLMVTWPWSSNAQVMSRIMGVNYCNANLVYIHYRDQLVLLTSTRLLGMGNLMMIRLWRSKVHPKVKVMFRMGVYNYLFSLCNKREWSDWQTNPTFKNKERDLTRLTTSMAVLTPLCDVSLNLTVELYVSSCVRHIMVNSLFKLSLDFLVGKSIRAFWGFDPHFFYQNE